MSRPARPLLATVICVYEVSIVVLALVLPSVLRHFNPIAAHPTVTHPPSPLQAASGWLSYALAVAAAIALWQMRRLAFVLLAVRFALSLLLLLIRLPRLIALNRGLTLLVLQMSHNGSIAPLAILWGSYAVAAAHWILSAMIVLYVYRITSSRTLPA